MHDCYTSNNWLTLRHWTTLTSFVLLSMTTSTGRCVSVLQTYCVVVADNRHNSNILRQSRRWVSCKRALIPTLLTIVIESGDFSRSSAASDIEARKNDKDRQWQCVYAWPLIYVDAARWRCCAAVEIPLLYGQERKNTVTNCSLLSLLPSLSMPHCVTSLFKLPRKRVESA